MEEYRKSWEKWSLDEVPIKKTRPVGYVYICDSCKKRFETDYELHIPWCQECRLKNFEEILRR